MGELTGFQCIAAMRRVVFIYLHAMIEMQLMPNDLDPTACAI